MPALDPDAYRHIVFFTGAGLSAESGVPTYRGAGGIWAAYDYGSYACQRAFESDPDKVWAFHDERRVRMQAVAPSLAHRIIAELAKQHPSSLVITQNIDGLHQRAGSHPVTELHGSIWRVRCECPDSPREVLGAPIPDRHCPTCGAWRRPDIIWFEDALNEAPIRTALEALAACDLLISIGTSGVVFPAADLPRVASEAGATCIEVNPEATPVSGLYDRHMRMGASDALSALWPKLAAQIKSQC
jgi:NAD-dependent deacetylase